jgi:biotin carboxyl carrier protein
MNEFVVVVNDSKYKVKISSDEKIVVNDLEYFVELSSLIHHSYLLKINDRVFELTSEQIGSNDYNIFFEGHKFETTVLTILQEKAQKLLEGSGESVRRHTEIKSPMPGMILKLKKSEGDKVEIGDSIVILEAMKMENDLKAPASGIIEKIYVTEGSTVEKGVLLFSIT